MIKHSMKLAAALSILSATVLANDAMAMTQVQCKELPGNMFLAAIERGDCDLNIQTAAGPQEELIVEDPKRDPGHDGRTGGRGGGKTTDGDGKDGGSPGGRTHP
jgi:hypothetical protein